ncbi:alanine--tRNA ligase [Nocardioides albus]|uniref:Alanine--tRNA ligase n=1 Tax=Nocardioides albus TaxID=1841 RepID=A0A7W5A8W4_9ACTN|nr:alanine--tRNA ligase [Nocardioides albus]MBB3091776.1 alanyl-tRNA synthetase [Nocardioides albus]GGU31957.1 alanine--tRNA ligase [Nocardioides albus]
MEWLSTAEIRRRFTAHFAENTEIGEHTVVPSASLLLDDPNLLFVNAGMVPFKPYFLGQATPPYDRATSVQKCIRTPDIEEVGKTTRHGTFFEMCGNFSFGDYFKEGAITLAWELITKSVADGGFGFDESVLYPSVLNGDDEAVELWKKITGLPDDRIVRLPPSENYWSMGVPGPGGPCSEILIDRGPEFGADRDWDAGDRYLEFWNLVFMQDNVVAARSKYDVDIDGPLAQTGIDTGLGLERVAYLMQGKANMYETDVVFPVIEKAMELTGKKYGAAYEDDVRFRVVADHVRSSLMLIGDGVTPGNEGRGYVLRRLMRRAIRNMRLLGYEDPAMPELLPISRDKMGETYTDLHAGWDRIKRVADAEEEAFRKTLAAGTQIFDLAATEVKSSGSTTFTGAKAFQLHDTYGFPIDLTLEMAAEAGLEVDEPGFRGLMTEQRERAKADARAKKGQHADVSVYRTILDTNGPTDWQAYTTLETESKPLALLQQGRPVDVLGPEEIGEIVLDRTPFYAESGGQSADAGIIEFDGGRLEVVDVQRPVKGLVVHQVRVVDGEFRGDESLVHAQVDKEWRLGARQAHSGTHVVHAALREVLGPTALQSGSFNRPGYLRLDYGWTKGLTPEQMHEVEEVSNHALRADLPVSWDYMTLPQAKEWGAIALFGETYDDTKVRVVEIGGPWSRELCGGTHVDHSAQIGTIVVTSEASVGSGNRRIEAYTGVEGFDYLARERDVVSELNLLLKTKSDDVVGRVSDLMERLKAAEKEIARARTAQLLASGGSIAATAVDVNGVQVVAQRIPGVGGGDARTLAQDVRSRLGDAPAAVVLFGDADDKVAVVAAVNPAGIAAGVKAGDLIKELAPVVGGRGGGKPDFAQGGGTEVGKIDEAVAKVKSLVTGA